MSTKELIDAINRRDQERVNGFNDVKLESLTKHIVAGGDVPSWCANQNIQYHDLVYIIINNKEYLEKYSEALEFRKEWGKEVIFSKIKEVAEDTCERGQVKLKALEMLGKCFGMFEDKTKIDLNSNIVSTLNGLAKKLPV